MEPRNDALEFNIPYSLCNQKLELLEGFLEVPDEWTTKSECDMLPQV